MSLGPGSSGGSSLPCSGIHLGASMRTVNRLFGVCRVVSDSDEAALLSTKRPVEGQVSVRSRRDVEMEALEPIFFSLADNHIVSWSNPVH